MRTPFDFSQFQFHPILHLAEGYEVYDFSQGYNPDRSLKSEYGIGRYNERRPGMYSTEIFKRDPSSIRDIHIGLDLAAPVGTPVFAFFEGEIFDTKIHPSAGDYGGTVVTMHELRTAEGGEPRTLWALYGHLSHESTRLRSVGERIEAGDVVGHLGGKEENGGWNPHLHFQLSWLPPKNCDLPGAVNEKDLAQALLDYPDPRLIVGPLY